VWLLLAWLAVAIVMLVVGALAVRSAQRQLEPAKRELTLANLDKPTPKARALEKSVKRGHAMFGSPVVAPLKLLPVLGRQLRSVDALANAVRIAVDTGLDARERAEPIVADPPKNGRDRLEAITAVGEIARDGVERLKKVDLGPSRHLFRPLADTRNDFATEVNRIGATLQRAEAGAAGLEAFFKGPSRYAVFAANNAEMRSGSGMYLSGGTLDVSDGKVKLGPMQSIYDLAPAPNNVALEYDFLRLWGPQAPGSDYRFVNMTPRFPTTGALLQRMWAASGAPPVDGVLVLDPVAASQLLRVVGPVTVDGQKVSAGRSLKLFLHDQYLKYDAKKAGSKDDRRDYLADVVQHIFAEIDAGHVDPTKLGMALADAAAGRHVLAWTGDKKVQQAWNALGVDGVLPDQSLMFSLQNRGGNKLDYFQEVEATANAKLSRAGSIVDVDFRITNAVPAGEPPYIAGPTKGSYIQEPNVYVGIASINLPANATDVKLTGGQYDLVSGPDGNTQLVSQWLQINQGQTLRLHLRFSLPPGYQSLTVLPSARVPTVRWHIGRQSWSDRTSRVIVW
jgi:hypothetical protein